MTLTPVRVLVAEDSPTARALLVAILASDPGLSVVGEAKDGMHAVALAAQLQPDVITMDIEMPVMSGLEAIREIMAATPTPIVVVSSAADRRESALSLDATEAGALGLANKPVSPRSPQFEDQCEQLVATVKAMAGVKVVRRWSRGLSRDTPESQLAVPARVATPARLVAVAASTGGPAALHEMLRRLPSDFAAPIVVVQHIADGFTGAFASWLDGGCRLRVKMAAHGERLLGGTVYVAPEGVHCGVSRDGRVALDDGPPIGRFRPSATHLYRSAAAAYGAGLAAVILTGMGDDGVAGLRQVHAAGGCVLAQSEQTCVVFGMPREAIRAGVATASLSPAAIADRLKLQVRGGADEGKHSRR